MSPYLLECAKSKIEVLWNLGIPTDALENFAATVFSVGTVLYTGDGDCKIFQHQTYQKKRYNYTISTGGRNSAQSV